MALDSRIAAFLAERPPATVPASLDDLRAATEVLLRQLHGPLEEVARIQTYMAPGLDGYPIRIRAYVPVATQVPLPAIIYAHGGGWFQCSLNLYDNPCRALARATGCVVLSVDYRLAPEHKFPSPLQDYYAALCWVVANAELLGVDPTRLIVGGDSAGANLAAAAALQARDEQGPTIFHQLLLYPPLDFSLTTPSYQTYADGYFLTRAAMQFCWSCYLDRDEDGDSPYASPLKAARLQGLPSATILVAEYDPLRDEGEAYGQRLREAGVVVECHRLKGMVHACIHMLGLTSNARQLFDGAADSLRRALNGALGDRAVDRESGF